MSRRTFAGAAVMALQILGCGAAWAQSVAPPQRVTSFTDPHNVFTVVRDNADPKLNGSGAPLSETFKGDDGHLYYVYSRQPVSHDRAQSVMEKALRADYSEQRREALHAAERERKALGTSHDAS